MSFDFRNFRILPFTLRSRADFCSLLFFAMQFLYLTFFGCVAKAVSHRRRHQETNPSFFWRNRFTWLELPWLYPAEINPLRTRTMANAVSTINNWLFNFVSPRSQTPFRTNSFNRS